MQLFSQALVIPAQIPPHTRYGAGIHRRIATARVSGPRQVGVTDGDLLFYCIRLNAHGRILRFGERDAWDKGLRLRLTGKGRE